MANVKFKWKVAPEPTGRFRSFENRMWPDAIAEDGTPIATLDCPDAYNPRAVRNGQHGPITLRIRFRKEVTAESPCKWQWRKLVAKSATLDEAKLLFKTFMDRYPDHDFALESSE